jgi:hypothetical protein
VVQQGIWRIIINQEFRDACKDLDIVPDITKNSLELVGHVVGMDQARTVKKI